MEELGIIQQTYEIMNLEILDSSTFEFMEQHYNNGWYNLADQKEFLKMPIDVRYEVKNYVTYKMAALLLKVYRKGNKEVYERLCIVLESCISVHFDGHGYESNGVMLDSLIALYENGLKSFLKENKPLQAQFQHFIHQIRMNYQNIIADTFYQDVTKKAEKLLSLIDDDILFVYGTLMKGQHNHHYLRNQHFICDGTLDNYALLQLYGYPGAVEETEHHVAGELYRCDAKAMAQIDYLEGNQYKKVRKVIKTQYCYYSAILYEYINNECRNDFLNLDDKWRTE